MGVSIQEIIKKIEAEKATLGIRLYEKASAADIASFERSVGVALPEEIKTFYLFCNGFESEEDLFRIIPLDEIINRNNPTQTDVSVDFDFAEYMIYSDLWTITMSKADSSDYLIHNSAEGGTILTNSFSGFIDRFLEGGVYDGLMGWK